MRKYGGKFIIRIGQPFRKTLQKAGYIELKIER